MKGKLCDQSAAWTRLNSDVDAVSWVTEGVVNHQLLWC